MNVWMNVLLFFQIAVWSTLFKISPPLQVAYTYSEFNEFLKIGTYLESSHSIVIVLLSKFVTPIWQLGNFEVLNHI